MIRLPVDDALPTLRSALERCGAAVLVAPPGSGKTTRVPPALAEKGRVLVLQPRRVAARAAARRVAWEQGETLGQGVGYRTRFDRKSGPNTRIEFLTEALLLRRLQRDPFLEDVAAVVLDEFHERSLAIDLALALLAELRQDARPDLAVVVMSATLAAEPVARFLDADIVRAEGRAFPVDIRYRKRPASGPLAPRVAAAVRRGLGEEPDGHVLVFLPGVGEIRGVARELEGIDAEVLPLHGRLPPREQDAALAPSPRRKVVLATNVAETSVTIDGVTLVIDTGLARIARFDAGSGVQRLELSPISRASADQRAGRAGRTRPGRCERLWTEAEQVNRPAADVPAVRRSDLSDALLLLADLGVGDGFAWFEAPPPGLLDRAESLLSSLEALEDGAITPRGRAMLELPMGPRLAAAALAGADAGIVETIAAAVALAAERDPFERCLEPGDTDLEGRLALLAEADAGARLPGVGRAALREVQKARDQVRRALEASRGGSQVAPLASALLAGFPDRVAQRRGTGTRLRLSSGGGARLPEGCPEDAGLLLVVSLTQRGRDPEPTARLTLALEAEWLPAEEAHETAFDPEREAVVTRRVRRWGALVLSERPGGSSDAQAVSETLLTAAQDAPERCLSPTPADEALLRRLAFVARARPELGLGDLAWADLLPTLCLGRRSFKELRAVRLSAALRDTLTWPQRKALDADAPEHLQLPGGRASIEYPNEGPPLVRARIQQFFGLDETPTLAGRAVVLELLAPNRRPAQRTDDLPGFWRGSYAEVRKELRGRYPKHAWPEEPWTASPRRRRR